MKKLSRHFIPNLGTLIILGLFLFAQAVGAFPLKGVSTQSAALPALINYQGRLNDAGGTPVPDGSYTMTFRLYSQATGGSPLWTEVRDVPVSNGLFNVMLGEVTALPAPFPVDPLYLGVKVGADAEMAPREQVTSVPYAMIAGTVPDGSITTAKIANGAVTSRKLSLTYGQIDIPWTSTSSNDWIDIPNSTLVLNADVPSILEVTADLLLGISNTDTAANYAINVNGRRWTNRFLQGGGWDSSVAQYISPVDAGPVTIKLQWRRAYGSGTITLNNVGGMSYLSAKLWSR